MKTIRLHKLQGTYEHSRHGNKLEVKPLKKLVVPDGLSLEERQVFTVVGNKMILEGALTELDLCLLESYAIQICLMRLAHRSLQKAGHVCTFKNKAGHKYEVPSGWVAILKSSTELAARIGGQLGLSPISRNKVSKDKTPDENSGLLK